MDPPDEPEETGIHELLGALKGTTFGTDALNGTLFGTDALMGTLFGKDTF